MFGIDVSQLRNNLAARKGNVKYRCESPVTVAEVSQTKSWNARR